MVDVSARSRHASTMTPHTLLLGSSIFLIVMALPLWFRRVPPNRWYGVRTRATLSDESLWYDVNEACGRDLFIAGVLVLLGTMIIERVGALWVPELRNLAAAAVLIVSLGWVSLRAMRGANAAR